MHLVILRPSLIYKWYASDCSLLMWSFLIHWIARCHDLYLTQQSMRSFGKRTDLLRVQFIKDEETTTKNLKTIVFWWRAWSWLLHLSSMAYEVNLLRCEAPWSWAIGSLISLPTYRSVKSKAATSWKQGLESYPTISMHQQQLKWLEWTFIYHMVD